MIQKVVKGMKLNALLITQSHNATRESMPSQ